MTEKPLTILQAIAKARTLVGQPYRFGDQWVYSVRTRNGSYTSQPGPYSKVRDSRQMAVAEAAAEEYLISHGKAGDGLFLATSWAGHMVQQGYSLKTAVADAIERA